MTRFMVTTRRELMMIIEKLDELGLDNDEQEVSIVDDQGGPDEGIFIAREVMVADEDGNDRRFSIDHWELTPIESIS
jgi:hypothetical protein